MEFTLIYQGSLKANGSVEDKQHIRREFHKQLAELWKQEPLSYMRDMDFLKDNPPSDSTTIIQNVSSFRFAPLVCTKLYLVAELDIIFLRPESPGRIVTQGGDIDNRLKTLFDALRMPKETKEIPKGDCPKSGEDPFYCLLEDDNFIVKLAVKTDRLLSSSCGQSHVNLMIHVQTKALIATYANASLG